MTTSARYCVSIPTVTVDTAVGNSSVIDYGDFEKGMVFVPSPSSLGVLNWYASETKDGAYLPVNNAVGTASQTVNNGEAYAIPDELKGSRFLKIVGDAAGVVGVTLKD